MKSIIKSELFENSVCHKKFSVDFLTDEIIENNININNHLGSGVIKELQLDGIYLINTNLNIPKECRFEISNNFPVFVLHFERSEEHTSELQSRENLVCRLLLEKK